MKKIILTAALFVLITNLSIAETRTLNLGEFTSISVGQNFQVQLMQADRNEIIVPENIRDDVFQVSDNLLRIQGANVNQVDPIIVLFKTLDSLIVSGTARVSSEHQIIGDRLRVRLIGASRVTLVLAYENVSSRAYGASQLNMSGTVANMLRVVGHGAATINAEQLVALRTDIHMRGAARANINTETATGSILETVSYISTLKQKTC